MGLADKIREMAKTGETAVEDAAKEVVKEVEQALVNEAPKLKAPAEALVKEAVQDFADSAQKLEELRAGRNESDIPLNDQYWDYRNAHQLAHNANQFVEKVEEVEKLVK